MIKFVLLSLNDNNKIYKHTLPIFIKNTENKIETLENYYLYIFLKVNIFIHE